MKKYLAITVLSLGMMPNASYGMAALVKLKNAFTDLSNAIQDAVPEVIELAMTAPSASDQVKASLTKLKSEVNNKQYEDALNSLSNIITNMNSIMGPSANLLGAMNHISIIRNKVPQLATGVSKIKDLNNSLASVAEEVNKLAGTIKTYKELEAMMATTEN